MLIFQGVLLVFLVGLTWSNFGTCGLLYHQAGSFPAKGQASIEVHLHVLPQLTPYLIHEKKPITFHCTGWFIDFFL